MISRLHGVVAAAVFAVSAMPAVAQNVTCGPAATPVLGLEFASRYVADDETRSELDDAPEAEALAALGPVDTFVSALANLLGPAPDREVAVARARCAVDWLTAWAHADALAQIGTETAALTVASRLSGIAIAAHEALALAPDPDAREVISAWLVRRMTDQMTFWETAPNGAARGNLRAWAALAAASVAEVSDDALVRGWAAWSVSYVACTADAQGAIPQEMSRGKRAMHYQLHAVAPLVTAEAILRRQGQGLGARCDNALDRIVAFTLDEIASEGAGVTERTGELQTTFANGGPRSFQLAWIEPWLTLRQDARAEALAAPMRPLSYSKLGGNQTAIWTRN